MGTQLTYSTVHPLGTYTLMLFRLPTELFQAHLLVFNAFTTPKDPTYPLVVTPIPVRPFVHRFELFLLSSRCEEHCSGCMRLSFM